MKIILLEAITYLKTDLYFPLTLLLKGHFKFTKAVIKHFFLNTSADH